MKKIFCVAIVLLISVGLFANGLSLNSIGPKALGMGGAFIGLADDGSAIYWNPAGLAGQHNAISVSVADIIPMANYDLAMYGIEAEAEMNHYISPNIFVNYNVGKFVFGLGAYVPAGLGAEWDGADLVAFNGPAAFDPTGALTNAFYGTEFEWMSKIGVFDISPAVSYELSDQLSIGVAANIYYGMLELKRGADFFGYDFDPTSPTFGTPVMGVEDGMLDTQQLIDVTGFGYGGAFGLMWKPSEKVNVGFSYRSPVNVEFEGDAGFENPLFALVGMTDAMAKMDAEMDIEWPTWIGGGVAIKASDKLTLTADAQYTNWAAMEKVDVIVQMPTGETVSEMHLLWKDAIQYRLGLEYMMKHNLALRTGWYYDPQPAPDETLTILFPSGTYSVLTGGFSYWMGMLGIDFGAEYLFGAERNVAAAADNMPGKHYLDIFAASLGIRYKF